MGRYRFLFKCSGTESGHGKKKNFPPPVTILLKSRPVSKTSWMSENRLETQEGLSHLATATYKHSKNTASMLCWSERTFSQITDRAAVTAKQNKQGMMCFCLIECKIMCKSRLCGFNSNCIFQRIGVPCPSQSCISLRLTVELSDERCTKRAPAALRALSSYIS